MPSVDIVITNKLGLHARAASKPTQLAGTFQSEVFIARGAQRVNAKSIMGVMILAVQKGDEIVIEASGDDEKLAVEKLIELINNKFGLPDES